MSTEFIASIWAGVFLLARMHWVMKHERAAHWRNCEACGWALVRVGPEGAKAEKSMRGHLGHRLHTVSRMTLVEYVKVLAGAL